MSSTTPLSPTLVLVHGSFANSFSFAPLQAELAARGVRSLAVDLPGHGFDATFPAGYQAPQDPADLASAEGSIRGVTLADAVQHVIEVCERAREHGPIMLLSHSRGGLTATLVANQRPDLVDELIYVSAWAPVDVSVDQYYAGPEMADVDVTALGAAMVADPGEVGLLRSNFRTADPQALANFRDAFLADATDNEFRVMLNTFQPDEALDAGGPDDRADAATWGTIPRTYVRLLQDRSLPPAMQDRMIAEADALTPTNPYEVHDLDSGHLRWLIRPQAAADLLARIVTAAPRT